MLTLKESKEFGEAVSEFLTQYEAATINPVVKNPISYALYHTWKYFDRVEKDRISEAEKWSLMS